ncbi:3-oxoacyl-[acyl-carrier-protein] synthase III C-terminal domain-containing protein [Streptomyces sp. NPDC051217]|uniref:3-oxoacyl-[acyl-carrier-protein] synthase III C-terminal domain-containing protein n=1 Tax=Streptomyces sp. NPDC051217 TaxID=3365644 RepID=UPI003787839B
MSGPSNPADPGPDVPVVHLSAIGHAHGEPRPVPELDVLLAAPLAPGGGLETYRVSDLETWELAALAAGQTLRACPAPPDMLLYVSQNDADTVDSLAHLMERLGLPSVDHLVVAGHDCGNFGPALRLARDLLRDPARERVLLVMADRAGRARQRAMANGMSVFSDGAASCLVTAQEPAGSGPCFAVEGVATRTRVRPEAGSAQADILATVELARGSVADLVRLTGRAADEHDHVVFANYRTDSQQFLAQAMGFPDTKLLLGSVGRLAHCFSADILVTLDEQYTAGGLKPGSRLLAAATGPASWSTLALRVL